MVYGKITADDSVWKDTGVRCGEQCFITFLLSEELFIF